MRFISAALVSSPSISIILCYYYVLCIPSKCWRYSMLSPKGTKQGAEKGNFKEVKGCSYVAEDAAWHLHASAGIEY
jgi:hypothetical protein